MLLSFHDDNDNNPFAHFSTSSIHVSSDFIHTLLEVNETELNRNNKGEQKKKERESKEKGKR
jgi:hypothetical protein